MATTDQSVRYASAVSPRIAERARGGCEGVLQRGRAWLEHGQLETGWVIFLICCWQGKPSGGFRPCATLFGKSSTLLFGIAFTSITPRITSLPCGGQAVHDYWRPAGNVKTGKQTPARPCRPLARSRRSWRRRRRTHDPSSLTTHFLHGQSVSRIPQASKDTAGGCRRHIDVRVRFGRLVDGAHRSNRRGRGKSV